MPVYDEKYIKAKVRQFNGMIETNFLDNEIPKKNVFYACIARITIGSVMKIKKKKKNYPRVYLEECKYKLKKIKMSKFITTELKSKSELKSDVELESKSELESNSE